MRMSRKIAFLNTSSYATHGVQLFLRALARDEGGQAIIEYVMMASIVVGAAAIMAAGFRKSVFSVWRYYTKSTAAACPGCAFELK